MERWKYFWNLCLKIHSKKKIHPYGAQGFSRIDAIKLHVLPNLTDNFYPLKSLVHDNNHRSTVNKKVDLKHHHHFSYHKNSSNKKKEYCLSYFSKDKKNISVLNFSWIYVLPCCLPPIFPSGTCFCRREGAWNLSKWYLQYLPWKWRKKPIFQLNKTANFRKICRRSWKKFKSPEFPVEKFWHFFIIFFVVFYFHFFFFLVLKQASKQLHIT